MNVSLPYPPKGINHQYRRGWDGVFLADGIAGWKQECMIALRDVPEVEYVAQGHVEVTLHVYRPSARGDVDARIKLLLDVLQGYAYKNDAQVRVLHVVNDVDRAQPRVEVEWKAA